MGGTCSLHCNGKCVMNSTYSIWGTDMQVRIILIRVLDKWRVQPSEAWFICLIRELRNSDGRCRFIPRMLFGVTNGIERWKHSEHLATRMTVCSVISGWTSLQFIVRWTCGLCAAAVKCWGMRTDCCTGWGHWGRVKLLKLERQN
jgi:hypothetical protein